MEMDFRKRYDDLEARKEDLGQAASSLSFCCEKNDMFKSWKYGWEYLVFARLMCVLFLSCTYNEVDVATGDVEAWG